MKIAVISPILAPETEDYRTVYRYRDCKQIPCDFDFFYIEEGPACILNDYDDVHAAVGLLKKVVQAEKEGYEAVVINCSADTALRACREAVSIPVIGPSECTMLYAGQLVDKFCVLTFAERINGRFERIAYELGVANRLACIESVELSFHDISNGQGKVENILFERIKEITEQTGCDGFILGCTDFEDVAPKLSKKLQQENIEVVLFKPFEIAAYQAYMTASMGLKQGKNSYPLPDTYF